MRVVWCNLAGLLMVLVLACTGVGAVDINNCTLINSPGYYVLTTDITDSTSDKCIVINASDVIFNGNWHLIDGTNGWDTYGIYVNNPTALTNITIQNVNLTNWDYAVYFNNTSNVRLVNVTLDAYYGVYVSNSENFVVENSSIESYEDGVYIVFSANVTVKNCDLEAYSADYGIDAMYADGINIVNNSIDVDGTAVSIGYTNNSTISGNTIWAGNGEGVEISYSNNNTITGNEIHGGGNGIELYNSHRNRIEANTIEDSDNGIVIRTYSSYNVISNNTISSNYENGIDVSSSNNTIFNNTIYWNGDDGIYLWYSWGSGPCSNNTIEKNEIYENGDGIYIFEATNNLLINNSIHDNEDEGIDIFRSPNNVLRNNTLTNNSFSISGSEITHFYQDIDTSNKVDGRPIYYLVEKTGVTIDGVSASLIALVSCNNVAVTNSTVTGSEYGILILNTTNSKISSNEVYGTGYGIYIKFDSSENTINSNNIHDNGYSGIYIYDSPNNTFRDNVLKNNTGFHIISTTINYYNQSIDTSNMINGKPTYYLVGERDVTLENLDVGFFALISCSNITARNLNITAGNYFGVLMVNASDSLIESNVINDSEMYGIYMKFSSENNTVRNNEISYCYDGVMLEDTRNNVISNNRIYNNRYGVYLRDASNTTLSNNTIYRNTYYGFRAYSSSNITISGNSIYEHEGSDEYDGYGIGIYRCSNFVIEENDIRHNDKYGIYIEDSNGMEIIKNDVIYNIYGIYLYYSDDNVIYLNNFVTNDYNVKSIGSNNIWNSTEKMTYTYNGVQYTNYMGNYWDDYTGSDTDGDGIGDTAYSVDSNDRDYHPLMQRWEEYFKLGAQPTIEIEDTRLYIYSDTQPRLMLDRWYFYNDSNINHNITIEVRLKIANLPSDAEVNVSANLSEILGTFTEIHNTSWYLDTGWYVFLLKYDIYNKPVVEYTWDGSYSYPHIFRIPVNVTIQNSSGVLLENHLGNVSAVINFDLKEDVPNVAFPNTTSWRTIIDYTNVTNLVIEGESGRIRLFGPLNLLEEKLFNSLFNLTVTLQFRQVEKLIAILDAAGNNSELNKSSEVVFYNVTSGFNIYAVPESGGEIEIYNGTTGEWDANYLLSEPVVKRQGDNYSVHVTVKHWSGYRLEELGMPLNLLPVVDFTFTPASPLVDETITFNATASYDPDGTIVNYTWNFGDGNVTTTASPLITHSYSSSGTYTVNLTVTDNDGLTNSTTKQVTVSAPTTTTPAPSGGGWYVGGGAGGGGAGFTEPPLESSPGEKYTGAETVVGEATIEPPADVRDRTGVVEVNIRLDQRMTVSYTIAEVKDLKGKPSPPFETYSIFEIVFAKYGTKSKVEPSGTIIFRVPKSWVESWGYDRHDVVLMKYRGEWVELPTVYTREDESYYYYQARLSSFSIFAVVAKPEVTTTATTTTTIAVTQTTAVTTTTAVKPGIPGFELVLAIAAILFATRVFGS